MSSYTQIIYHLVWSTKFRTPVLEKENRQRLFQYIAALLRNKKCHLYCINGVEDHLHILTHVHQTIALARLVKDIKIASSIWIKENNIFPGFKSWQIGYAALSCAYKDKDPIIAYIKNQEIHHQKKSFKEEYTRLLAEHGIDFQDKYLFEGELL